MSTMELTDELRQKLEAEARAAAARAYCPYSNFHVGAAILAGWKIFTGANVENASYGLTICAERTAAFAAVLAGHQDFQAVAVCCADVSPEQALTEPESLMPCGACRQLLAEFSNENTVFLVAQAGSYRFNELMPHPFQLRKMPKSQD